MQNVATTYRLSTDFKLQLIFFSRHFGIFGLGFDIHLALNYSFGHISELKQASKVEYKRKVGNRILKGETCNTEHHSNAKINAVYITKPINCNMNTVKNKDSIE